MDFTIYVLGDVRLFADTLNGIAMIFTVADGGSMDIWASNTNNMGLGMGAFLGMLLAILSLIYNAAFRQKFDIITIAVPLILYMCLTVPKVTVNIVDGYYRDGAQSVDNVPVGLALPLSAISSMSFKATEKLETVFTVPSNGTFTKITEDGFVMPIKMLHALRYTGIALRDAYPNMNKSVVEVTRICLTNNNGFSLSEYQNTNNSLGTVVSAMSHISVGSRLVTVFPYNDHKGKVTNCAKASEYIRNSLKAYMDGTIPDDIPTLIGGDMLKQKNLKNDMEKILATQSGNTVRNITDTSTMRILDDIQNFTKETNDEAIHFIEATLLNPQMSTAAQCVSGAHAGEISRCMSYKTSEEQWKEKSAAEASGFLSIMRDGQNLLILLSITLFPIMILVVVLQGVGGLKVVMSYLLYTISAYMWIPVAAMINWFSQVQLHDEMDKWISRVPVATGAEQGFLSLANAPLFYDAISKRLAVANTVMASVPVICMGIFGGMLWSMNRLADKMNPQTGFDESVNTPDVVSREALANVGSAISFDGAASVGKINASPDMEVLSNIRERANSVKQSETHLENASMSAAKALGERIALSKDNSELYSLADKAMEMHGFSKEDKELYERTRGSVVQSLAMMGTAHNISQQADYSTALKTGASQAEGGSLGLDILGLLKRKSPVDAGAEIQAKAFQKYRDALEGSTTTSTTGGYDYSVTGTTSEGQANRQSRSETSTRSSESSLVALASTTATTSESLTNSLTNSSSYNQNLANARSEMQSYQEQQRHASTISINTEQLLNLDTQTGGKFSEAMDAAYAKHSGNEAVKSAYNNSITEVTSMSGAHNKNLAKQFHALTSVGGSAANDAFLALGSVGAAIGGSGINGDGIQGVSSKVNDVRSKVAQETEPVNAIKAPDTNAAKIKRNFGQIQGMEQATADTIDQQARRVAQKQGGGPDYAQEVLGKGQAMAKANNDAYNDVLRATQYPDKLANGDHVNISVNKEGGVGNFLARVAGRDGITSANDDEQLKEILMFPPDQRTPDQKQRLEAIRERQREEGIFSQPFRAVKATALGEFAKAAKVVERATGDASMTEKKLDVNGNFSSSPMTITEFGMKRNREGVNGSFVGDAIDKTKLTDATKGLNEALQQNYNNGK